MVCIYCGRATNVVNSRTKARYPGVWRRRACQACVAQFTTREFPDLEKSIVVQKSAKDLEPFQRDVIFISVYQACGHRADAVSAATALTETALARLFRSKALADGLVTRPVIAKAVYATLLRFDRLAAGSYKAYHQASLKSAAKSGKN